MKRNKFGRTEKEQAAYIKDLLAQARAVVRTGKKRLGGKKNKLTKTAGETARRD
jgi:hypothetical protein